MALPQALCQGTPFSSAQPHPFQETHPSPQPSPTLREPPVPSPQLSHSVPRALSPKWVSAHMGQLVCPDWFSGLRSWLGQNGKTGIPGSFVTKPLAGSWGYQAAVPVQGSTAPGATPSARQLGLSLSSRAGAGPSAVQPLSTRSRAQPLGAVRGQRHGARQPMPPSLAVLFPRCSVPGAGSDSHQTP